MTKKQTKLMLGDNIESLRKLPDNSIDSVVTDPPYGLSFMNKKWDYDVPSVEFWREVYRVLKPGGHILSFGGTRTYHRMAVNIEDAGFEIRDQIQWIYASGFPKSHNIGKAVDKLEGNEREVVNVKKNFLNIKSSGKSMYDEAWHGNQRIDLSETKGQSPYEGWGTALKPANEPICVARKPLSEKSVAENVLRWRTGGINIDGCRVGSDTIKINGIGNKNYDGRPQVDWPVSDFEKEHEGRFPANIILECCCDEVIKGEKGEIIQHNGSGGIWNQGTKEPVGKTYNDKGDIHTNPNCPCYVMDSQNGSGASRFFYQAKVSKAERNMGLDGFDDKKSKTNQINSEKWLHCDAPVKKDIIHKNNHPTVKPVSLMAYLCRLITPSNGIVLDPFMGSGSTGIAAQLEGFRFCGMEMDSDYFKIAEARIEGYEKYRKFIK